MSRITERQRSFIPFKTQQKLFIDTFELYTGQKKTSAVLIVGFAMEKYGDNFLMKLENTLIKHSATFLLEYMSTDLTPKGKKVIRKTA